MYQAFYITENGAHMMKSIGSTEGIEKLLKSLRRRCIESTVKHNGWRVGGSWRSEDGWTWTYEILPGGKNV